jgi:hypothetical protein
VSTTITIRFNNKNNKGNLMSKWKRCEIELTPALMKKLLEYAKTAAPENIDLIVENLTHLSKSDDTLTIEEYEVIITKNY